MLGRVIFSPHVDDESPRAGYTRLVTRMSSPPPRAWPVWFLVGVLFGAAGTALVAAVRP